MEPYKYQRKKSIRKEELFLLQPYVYGNTYHIQSAVCIEFGEGYFTFTFTRYLQNCYGNIEAENIDIGYICGIWGYDITIFILCARIMNILCIQRHVCMYHIHIHNNTSERM